ncbi:MAG: CoA pyrophosphatase [Paracoccaceae bacterium]
MAWTEGQIAAALAGGPTAPRSDFDLIGPEARAAALARMDPAPRRAAVLCGLVPRPGGLSVVLTRRAAHLRRHAGQVAFPGGSVDPDDASDAAAALREANEEVGLAPAQVRLAGALAPYVTRTGFHVSPFVGFVDPDWTPRPDPSEVDLVFEAPLDFLMDPRNCLTRVFERAGERRRYYAFTWEGHLIWGATAGMLMGLADRRGGVAPGARAAGE